MVHCSWAMTPGPWIGARKQKMEKLWKYHGSSDFQGKLAKCPVGNTRLFFHVLNCARVKSTYEHQTHMSTSP